MKKIVLLTLFACCLFSTLSAQDLDYLRKYDAKIEEFVIESTELGQKRQSIRPPITRLKVLTTTYSTCLMHRTGRFSVRPTVSRTC